MLSRKLIGTLAVIAAASAVPVASAQTEDVVAVPDCIGLPATIVGQPGAGVIRGTNGPDVIVGTDEAEHRLALEPLRGTSHGRRQLGQHQRP